MRTYTLLNEQSGELAFKLYAFDSIRHFDHVQRFNYYSLVWIKKGKGKAQVDFNTYDYEEDMIFSFSPYQPFMFQSEAQTEGIILHFHSDFFCIHHHHEEIACNGVLFNNIYESPYVKIHDRAHATLNILVKEMEMDLSANQLALQESVLSYLKLFLINTSRLKAEQNPDALQNNKEERLTTHKLKTLIEENFKTMHAPKEYAEALHISPKALGKISKDHFNKTLTTLISERIIIEAKRELYLTGKSVKEIAQELGYEDEFYFSRFFKKNTDITPSTYRKTVGFNKAEQ